MGLGTETILENNWDNILKLIDKKSVYALKWKATTLFVWKILNFIRKRAWESFSKEILAVEKYTTA